MHFNLQAFTTIESLADGGVKMGLPRDMATKLAAQTLFVSRLVKRTCIRFTKYFYITSKSSNLIIGCCKDGS